LKDRGKGLQLEFLVAQAHTRQFGGTGRDPFKWVVPKGTAVGTGRHNPFFGAHHLILTQGAAMGAINAARLYFLLKQIHKATSIL